ncbi:F-box/kelch-repeat protein At3g06240-like [Rutidosis leptorrhynchoides]|uniref:F-box/kelch-repeat protein At3g06240-like n=1 Tax=Rutidosis leptorrhynchoides TaxID=125765 RepID=UPI003A9A0BD7
MSDSTNSTSALYLLPPDLIEAILPFLPPKSLGRFKSVSKRWYSLISSPEFIKTHIRNYTKNNPNPNPTHLILDEVDGFSNFLVNIKQLNTQPTPETLFAKRLNFEEPLTTIIGSCNGLLFATDKNQNLYFVNPTTRKSLKVPAGERTNGIYRFGYDSSTDDYKVISIPYNVVSDSTKVVRVYSLRNNSWNVLPNFSYKYDYHGPGVLLNNNLHWIVRGRHLTMAIAAFSLADEKLHEIEFPDSASYVQGRCTKLFALGDKLVVVGVGSHIIELWVMEEYGVTKSWTKLFVCNKDINLDYECFAQVSNWDIMLGNNESNEIVIYNMEERRCKSVTVEGCPEEFMVYGTYAESLESPERFR